jgi:hypothetical protein
MTWLLLAAFCWGSAISRLFRVPMLIASSLVLAAVTGGYFPRSDSWLPSRLVAIATALACLHAGYLLGALLSISARAKMKAEDTGNGKPRGRS